MRSATHVPPAVEARLDRLGRRLARRGRWRGRRGDGTVVDERGLDAVARAFAAPISRRRAVGVVSSALAAGSLLRPRTGRADARVCGGDEPKKCQHPAPDGPSVCVPSNWSCCHTTVCAGACEPTTTCIGGGSAQAHCEPFCPGPCDRFSICCLADIQAEAGFCNREPFVDKVRWCCPRHATCGTEVNRCECEEACGDRCCPEGALCVDDRCECETGNRCIDKCCPEDALCTPLAGKFAGSGICQVRCPEGFTKCGTRGSCCKAGYACCGQYCCPPGFACDGSVCNCQDGSQCGRRCCPPGTSCCGNGVCCQPYDPDRPLYFEAGRARQDGDFRSVRAPGGSGGGLRRGGRAADAPAPVREALAASAAHSALALRAFLDPRPDRRHRTAVGVPRPKPPLVSAGPGFDDRAAGALGALLAAEAGAWALLRAAGAARAKALGAMHAGDQRSARKQTLAAASLAARAARAIRALPAQRSAAASALRDAGVGDVVVDAEQITAYQASVRREGLPAGFTRLLRGLGLSAADLRDVRQVTSLVDPAQAAGAVLAPLTAPDALATLARIATRLEAYARSARRSPIVRRRGQPLRIKPTGSPPPPGYEDV